MAIKFNFESGDLSVEEQARMLLFTRWLAINYTSEELNTATGLWWIQSLNFYMKTAFPNAIENGSYRDMIAFIESKGEEDLTNHCKECGKPIEFDEDFCDECNYSRLPF